MGGTPGRFRTAADMAASAAQHQLSWQTWQHQLSQPQSRVCVLCADMQGRQRAGCRPAELVVNLSVMHTAAYAPSAQPWFSSVLQSGKPQCGCGTHLVDDVAACCCQSLGITASLEDGVQFKQPPSQHRVQLLVLHMQGGRGAGAGRLKRQVGAMVVCGRCCEVVGV